MALCRYKKMRAAKLILDRFRGFKVHSYFNKLRRAFSGISTDPHMAKHTRFPRPPGVLNAFAASVQKILACWRAQKLVETLTREDRIEMRLKCFLKCF